MRPRKIILYVSHSEQDLSVMKFMLEINGYQVVTASSGQEAVSIFCRWTVDLVLADLVLADFLMPRMNSDDLVKRLKRQKPYIPMILRGDPEKMGANNADAMLCNTCPASELLERIKIMSRRKRGPRKGYVRKPPGSVTVPDAAFAEVSRGVMNG